MKLRSIRDQDFGKLFKKSTITFGIKITGMVVGYLLTIIVTKSSGSEAWGNYALAYSVLQIFSILAKTGVDTASIRFISEFHSKGENSKMKDYYFKALSIVCVTSIFFSALLYFLSPFIAAYIFHKPYFEIFLKIVALGIIPQTIIDLHAEMFKGMKKPGIFAFFRFTSTHISTILFIGFILLFSSQNIDGYLAMKATTIGLWFASIVAMILWFVNGKFFSLPSEPSMSRKQILIVSGPMMISMSILMIMGFTDTLMLGSLLKNTSSLGIYNVASKISTTIALALMAVNSVSTPRYAEYYSNNQLDKVRKVVKQSTKLIFWVSFPLCLVCIIFPITILNIFGEEFGIGTTALILLTIGRFISSICGSVGYLLQMTGHQKIMQNIILISLIISIGLNYFLIPIYGINGAAFATMVSTAFWNIVGVYYIKKRLNILTIYYPNFLKRLVFRLF